MCVQDVKDNIILFELHYINVGYSYFLLFEFQTNIDSL